jgi:hypothetical protein
MMDDDLGNADMIFLAAGFMHVAAAYKHVL